MAYFTDCFVSPNTLMFELTAFITTFIKCVFEELRHMGCCFVKLLGNTDINNKHMKLSSDAN